MGNRAYLIIRQNQYMRRFRDAGATDPARAEALAELGLKPSRIFQNMRDKGVFRSGRAPETFYIDEGAAEEFVEARRRRTFYMLVLMLLAAAILFFLNRR